MRHSRRAAPLLLSLASVLASCSRIHAHGHRNCSESLGHHWESAAYLHEIHFQLAMLAVAVCVWAGLRLLFRTLKRGGERC